MSIQLDGHVLGALDPIRQVIVDKIGLYAYPLQRSRRVSAHTRSAAFEQVLMVHVHTQRRTKLVMLHSAYCLENRSDQPLQFRVRCTSSNMRVSLVKVATVHELVVQCKLMPANSACAAIVQVQAISAVAAAAAATGRNASVHALRPTFQLPLNAEGTHGGRRQLDPQQRCFVPLTALTEDLQQLRLAIATGTCGDLGTVDDYIELQGSALQQAQGVHRCNGTGPDMFVSLKVQQKLVQVRCKVHLA